ncbi:gamma-aminobutyraldehyde dehydrogenase [Paenarthrobacter ureafaciens]|uniref:aminobutyraldehyde dehydrogenase n=1 Tax=Paenarthrobacter ureafaciens TaxID=37931 RepID=UPI0015BBE28E|nr:aminobutyraldehyde dehydrogenase [Paenarthrobacter ureafaciens]NWL28043.1 gamma-aminobutyraldehyde dehydrogenase [Paenarthrobacter ureafaciens]
MNTNANFIDGTWIEPLADEQIDLIDPATEDTYGSIPDSTAEDVDRAFAAAERGFESWQKTTPGERQRALLRIADAIEARAEEFADAESRDTGKPRANLAEEEIMLSVDQIRFFAGAARNLQGLSAGEYLPQHTSMIRREPIGVVAQIAPWNFPLNMAVWKMAPAIAAGNSTVLKPAASTPSTAILLAEVAAEFLPAGVFNLVLGDRGTGRAMVQHPTPQLVSITGSTRAGMEVARDAADDLKRVHLELGGNAPVVVFNDADIQAAAKTIVMAGYVNAGQDCTAATRILAQDGVYNDLVAAVTNEARDSARTGTPNDPQATFGPVNNSNQLAHVSRLVDGLAPHAEITTGGKRWGNRGYFYEATVVAGVEQSDAIVQEEIFGPVVTIQRFSDEADAVKKANGVAYGLSSSVWTTDHGTAMRMSKALDFGCVWINTHIPVVAEMPHGGFKHSGYGKDLSMYGFEDYTRIKHVMSFTG